jgi:hypothetical protein
MRTLRGFGDALLLEVIMGASVGEAQSIAFFSEGLGLGEAADVRWAGDAGRLLELGGG